jgi:hypothetical protein
MASRALAASKAKRTGEMPPPYSGNRPITSRGYGFSAAGLQPAQQQPAASAPRTVRFQAQQSQYAPSSSYGGPPMQTNRPHSGAGPPNNMQTQYMHRPPTNMSNAYGGTGAESYPTFSSHAPSKFYPKYEHTQQPMYDSNYGGESLGDHGSGSSGGVPFTKLTVSDAIGLITLRLGKLEQWVIDRSNEEGGGVNGIIDSNVDSTNTSGHGGSALPTVDSSMFNALLMRIDQLEQCNEHQVKPETIVHIQENVKAMANKHKEVEHRMGGLNVEVTKLTSQYAQLLRDGQDNQTVLKQFMLKYDAFVNDTMQSFGDFESALAQLEEEIQHPSKIAHLNSSFEQVANNNMNTDVNIEATTTASTAAAASASEYSDMCIDPSTSESLPTLYMCNDSFNPPTNINVSSPSLSVFPTFSVPNAENTQKSTDFQNITYTTNPIYASSQNASCAIMNESLDTYPASFASAAASNMYISQHQID